MKTLTAFLLTLTCIPLGASDVRFPTRTVSVPSEPVQEIRIEVVTTLPIGELYIVESDSELMIRQFPEGLLNVREIAPGGIRPMGIDGLFAGGDREGETRVFSAAHIYSFRGVKPGRVQVDVIPKGTLIQTEADAPLLVLTVSGSGPQPPPKPDPEPEPEPDPVDPPAPTPSKLQIVIIHDPAKNADLPGSQIAAMDGQEVRQYAKTHCKMTGDTPDFRKLSVRQGVLNQPEWIKEAFNRPAPVLPAIVILTPTQTISGPLPQTVEETMALLKKYGGD